MWTGCDTLKVYGSKKVGSDQLVVQCAELSRLPTTGLRPVHSQLVHGKAGLFMDCQNTKTFLAKYIGLSD